MASIIMFGLVQESYFSTYYFVRNKLYPSLIFNGFSWNPETLNYDGEVLSLYDCLGLVTL